MYADTESLLGPHGRVTSIAKVRASSERDTLKTSWEALTRVKMAEERDTDRHTRRSCLHKYQRLSLPHVHMEGEAHNQHKGMVTSRIVPPSTPVMGQGFSRVEKSNDMTDEMTTTSRSSNTLSSPTTSLYHPNSKTARPQRELGLHTQSEDYDFQSRNLSDQNDREKQGIPMQPTATNGSEGARLETRRTNHRLYHAN